MSESFIAIVKEADQTSLYAWGWNEHGNLGLGDKQDRHKPTLVCHLTDKAEISTGGAFYFLRQ